MFSISSNSLPRIRSYEDALKFWTSARPQDNQFRALNPYRKSDTSKRIWSPDDGKTISLRLHHTDLVTYTKTDLVIKLYDSRSSAVFIDELTPMGFRTYSHRGEMFVNRMQDQGDGLRFIWNGGNYDIDPKTVRPQYRVKADSKIVAEVRKLTKPFFKYVKVRRAFEGIRTPTGPMRLTWSALNSTIEMMKDSASWPSAFSQCMHVTSEVLQRQLIAYLGGLSREELPIGELPKKSAYDGFSI